MQVNALIEKQKQDANMDDTPAEVLKKLFGKHIVHAILDMAAGKDMPPVPQNIGRQPTFMNKVKSGLQHRLSFKLSDRSSTSLGFAVA